MLVFCTPQCVSEHCKTTTEMLEVGSDTLTTEIFTRQHVHLKQQDIYATG